MFPPVNSKADFVTRYRRGEFGNHAPTWDTLSEWARDGSVRSRWRFHLRNRVAGGPTYYNLNMSQVIDRWMSVKAKDFYLSVMAPHDKNVIQGEVREEPGGLYLMYSPVVDKPMREALAEKTYHLYGLMAKCVLQRSLCWNSYDWLWVLLDRYPGHTVEFSTFSVNWGTLPNYNTVFWEIRNY